MISFLIGLSFILQTLSGEGPPPNIELYTMGEGESVMERYGHASLCVRWPDSKQNVRQSMDRCFNYGTMDMSDPVDFVFGFIRGESNFYVSMHDVNRMIATYVQKDRSVWVQRLPLSNAEAWLTADMLYTEAKPENRNYQYHHFFDNCTTRLRDILDAATGGTIARGSEKPWSMTFREASREGLGDLWWMNGGTDLILGHGSDEETTMQDGMFLPRVLMAEIEDRFHAKPEVVYLRKGPAFETKSSLARIMFAILGVLCALPVALWWWSKNKTKRWAALLALASASIVGLLIWLLAVLSPLHMMRYNEVLLVLWPFDIALAFINPKRARFWARGRLIWLSLILVLSVVGVLKQPLLQVLCWAALPLTFIALSPKKVSKP